MIHLFGEFPALPRSLVGSLAKPGEFRFPASLLLAQGITTLLWAGINTDRCVFSSLQDAGFLGYDNVLLADACGTPSPAYVSRAIHFLVQQLHGFVATTPALHAALTPTPQPPLTKENPR